MKGHISDHRTCFSPGKGGGKVKKCLKALLFFFFFMMLTKKQIVCQSELLNVGTAPGESREQGTPWHMLADRSIHAACCPSAGGEQALFP